MASVMSRLCTAGGRCGCACTAVFRTVVTAAALCEAAAVRIASCLVMCASIFRRVVFAYSVRIQRHNIAYIQRSCRSVVLQTGSIHSRVFILCMLCVSYANVANDSVHC